MKESLCFIHFYLKTEMNKIILASLLFLTACYTELNQKTINLKKYLRDSGRDERILADVYVLVPLFSSCHSCESKVIEFLKNDSISGKCQFIFSMHPSRQLEFKALINEQFDGNVPANLCYDFYDAASKLDLTFAETRLFYCGEKEIKTIVDLTAVNIDQELEKLKSKFSY